MNDRPTSACAGSPSSENILVFRTGQLGDMIVSLPAMWAIRHHWPQAHLTLLSDVHPRQKYIRVSDIFHGTGLFNSLEHYEVPSANGNRLAAALKKLELLIRLRTRGFKTLVYLAPSIRLRPQVERDRRFFRVAGFRTFLGMDYFPPVPNRYSPRPMPAAGHEADLLLARLRADGLPVPAFGQGSLELRLGAVEDAEIARWRQQLPADQGCIWIGVGPTSKMPAKRWPVERFAAAVKLLIDSFDVWPVVFGGPEDKDVGNSLISAWGRGFNAAGSLGIRAAARALGQCALYLGNDSGTMHLAAVAKTPCIGIFSSRDWPGSWYPYGVKQRVFRSEIDCEGCYLSECVSRNSECLNRIRVPEVVASCEAILREHSLRVRLRCPSEEPSEL